MIVLIANNLNLIGFLVVNVGASTELDIGRRARLRVADQRVGTGSEYSESAAENAYSNCEAIQYEQFDTDFELSFRKMKDCSPDLEVFVSSAEKKW